jgi:hypothetical protein
MSSDLEVASSPRPSLLPPASAGFSYCFTGGRPNVDLYLDAIPPTPSRRRPRGGVGLAQLFGGVIIDVEMF